MRRSGLIAAALILAAATQTTAGESVAAGASPPAARNVSEDWLSRYAYGARGTPGVFESATGQVGVAGACRTTDNRGGSAACIGGIGWAFNFNAIERGGGWGFYGECRRSRGSGPCLAAELDATEFDVSITPTSYGLNGSFTSAALWLASGGGCTATTPCLGPKGPASAIAGDASLAIGITTNVAGFRRGIVIGADALAGCVGSDVEANQCEAVELGRNQVLTWDAPGRPGRFMFGSIATSASSEARLFWSDAGLILQNAGGETRMRVTPTGAVEALYVNTGSTTVAGLARIDPAPRAGDRSFVTDADSCAFNSAISHTTGSTRCPVVYDGEHWIAG
jgi:hypothetical protein